jgi:hypothetical protein
MSQVSGWLHETVLSGEPVSAARTRDFIRQHLIAHDLPYMVEDIQLVASELATNAMVHARTPFAVTLSELDGLVLLDVRDGSTAVPARTAPQVMDLGGRGLMIVELLSHSWGVSTDGSGSKSVWASFATRTGPAMSSLMA